MFDTIHEMETPAFVIDEARCRESLAVAMKLASDAGCHLLYALKAQSNVDLVRVLREGVSGFAASSLFEAELARSIAGIAGSVHITTPGFRAAEMSRLNELCDFVALNSLSQLERFGSLLDDTSIGLRVNPELSFVRDSRFDPCRKRSKLGIPLRDLAHVVDSEPEIFSGVEGLHFHSNCDANDLRPLLKTVRRLTRSLDPLLRRLKWINLGGGYIFSPTTDGQPLRDAVGLLRDRYGVEVFVEPGASLARPAGYLVSSVIDLGKRGKEHLAYLDTTVNHMPEVYEYQFEPDVIGDSPRGRYEYRLVGSTCLAGDVFGVYAFEEPLHVGSHVIFSNMGAYTSVKAHMFNGINLPALYVRRANGVLELRKQYTYRDFASLCGQEEADANL